MFTELNKQMAPLKVMKSSETIGQIAKAMSQLQSEINNPANTALNPFYKSKYAPLPEVLNVARPILGKFGLAVIQNPYNDENFVYITTLVIHESGEWLETNPLQLKPEKNTPQGVGSAITYGRRYSLSAVLGLASEEDDDGNSNEPTSGKPTKGKAKNTEDKPEATPTQEELKPILQKVMSMAKSKAAQSDEIKSQVQAVLVKYHASGNPNKITEIDKANECLKDLENIKTEDK